MIKGQSTSVIVITSFQLLESIRQTHNHTGQYSWGKGERGFKVMKNKERLSQGKK
jgi:hypothetical protein